MTHSDDIVEGFLSSTSVGAIGVPELWYAVHGLWVRAGSLVVLRGIVAFVYFETFWSKEAPSNIPLEIAVWLVYWLPVVLLARTARLRAWAGGVDREGIVELRRQERNWAVVGALVIAVFVLQMTWWWTG